MGPCIANVFEHNQQDCKYNCVTLHLVGYGCICLIHVVDMSGKKIPQRFGVTLYPYLRAQWRRKNYTVGGQQPLVRYPISLYPSYLH